MSNWNTEIWFQFWSWFHSFYDLSHLIESKKNYIVSKFKNFNKVKLQTSKNENLLWTLCQSSFGVHTKYSWKKKKHLKNWLPYACYLFCGFSSEIHRIKNCIPFEQPWIPKLWNTWKSYGIPIFMESIWKFGGVIIHRLTFCRQTFHRPTTHWLTTHRLSSYLKLA